MIAFVLTVCAGLAAVLAVAANDERSLAFTLGVYPSGVVTALERGDTVCQAPVSVSEPFTHVQFQVGNYGRPGAPLKLEVRSPDAARLGEGTLAAGYPDVIAPLVEVGRIAAGQAVEVCVTNEGTNRTAVYGGPEAAAPTSEARVNGGRNGTDLALHFLRAEPSSTLELVPDMFQHASVFKAGWEGEWTFWLLGLLVLAGVPLLLAAAIGSARDPARAP